MRSNRHRKRSLATSCCCCSKRILVCILLSAVSINLLTLSKNDNDNASNELFSFSSSNNEWCEGGKPNDEISVNIENHFRKLWKEIDDITSSDQYKHSKVSGGIFLYPRQSYYLMRLIQSLLSNKSKSRIQVCETGFGSGHSTALFLAIAPNVNVLTFDKFDRKYQTPVVQRLTTEFGSRLQHIKGNSCETVPKFFKDHQAQKNYDDKHAFEGCDILHGSSLCRTDNIDLVEHAECGTILTSTAMHSISDRDVYFGPKAQWRKLRRNQCISDINCYNDETKTLDKSFVFASEKTTISHQFCFAIVTGKCNFRNGVEKLDIEAANYCNERILNARSLLNHVCPDDRIPVPNR